MVSFPEQLPKCLTESVNHLMAGEQTLYGAGKIWHRLFREWITITLHIGADIKDQKQCTPYTQSPELSLHHRRTAFQDWIKRDVVILGQHVPQSIRRFRE